MLKISRADFDDLTIALANTSRRLRLLNEQLPMLPRDGVDRLRAAAIAALAALSSDYVLVEDEIHLIPPAQIWRFKATPEVKKDD